jgi:hypothetical protein
MPKGTPAAGIAAVIYLRRLKKKIGHDKKILFFIDQ